MVRSKSYALDTKKRNNPTLRNNDRIQDTNCDKGWSPSTVSIIVPGNAA